MPALTPRVAEAVGATQRYLLSIQREDGHWCGELEGDTILGSEYVMALLFRDRKDDPRILKVAEDIRRKQLPDGAWAIYPGGRTEVSASVKAYFVLKLVGDPVDAPHMVRARQAILQQGGIEACNSFTKLQLAIFGQYDWAKCAAVPPELILLPRWFYINIYEMSSWSRAILIPLSIIWAHRPVCPIPEHAQISELYAADYRSPAGNIWANVFYGIDRGVKLLEKVIEKLPVKPSRELALKRCEQWILTRLEDSDGLGAIFPGIVNTIIALRLLGYAEDHPAMAKEIDNLERLVIEEDETLRVQPCFSPVWDTALTTNALVESGLSPSDPDVLRAARWMLGKRGNGNGDWRIKCANPVKPGWFFEYANPFYPDNDTTAMVLTALTKVSFPDQADEQLKQQAMTEAHSWHLSMQNSDGGWAAFDKDCDKELLTYVPFADHNAMIDPSNEDITARILETFVGLGYSRSYPPAQRALRFLLERQCADGSWYGRWGCNYLYGTWLALWGLKSIGEDPASGWGRRAAEWIRNCQNDDGGWGELPVSYDDATHKGRGPSTASQTAWALLGLMATDDYDSEAVRRGVEYLLAEQREDGSWHEEYWTGTGFPGVFYLRYHLYGTYFPLMALGCYQQRAGHRKPDWSKSA